MIQPPASDASRRIRVMQLVHSLKIGGSEKLALDISAHLDASRFCPSVCALDFGGDLAKEFDALGVPHYVMHRQGVEPDVFRRLYRLFRDNQIDVVHTHHFAQLFYAAVPARLTGARVIHTEHEFFTYLTNRSGRVLIRPLLSLCDVMTVVGPEVAEYFIETVGVPRSRVTVIKNGVDVPSFQYDRTTARKALGLDPDEFVVGTIGRLEPEKDQVTLLDVFQQLQVSRPALRLLIAGDGRMAAELKAHAARIGVEDRTSFLGYRRDIARLLAAMDVFVLPSIREGLPISLIEAMAASRPVVASDIGSVRNLVRDGEAGFVVAPRDTAAFTAAVRRLAEEPALRTRMGQVGHAAVVKSFSLSSAMQAYETLYRSAASRTHVRH